MLLALLFGRVSLSKRAHIGRKQLRETFEGDSRTFYIKLSYNIILEEQGAIGVFISVYPDK